MLQFGLNHMTTPLRSVADLLKIAESLGCVGVEFRNDLQGDLFDGQDPALVKRLAKAKGQRILALAEIKAFNAPEVEISPKTLELIQIASNCGAEGIALIPKVATSELPRSQQRQALKQSLQRLQPHLEAQGVIGLIEPLGFATSTLRFKDDVVAVLDDMNRPNCYRIIHDTFHHHLAGKDSIHADLTALVHISGVDSHDPNTGDMTDAHRGLIGPKDALNNIAQLRTLREAGYKGPVSFEAFSTDVHKMTDPAKALAGSIDFITDQLVGVPA